MQPKSAVMMRVLINRFYQGSPKTFLNCLPAEEAEAVLSIDLGVNDLTPALMSPQSKISNIHYTWFYSSIQKLPKEMQPIVAGAFPPPICISLCQGLNLPPLAAPLSEPVKAFLINEAYKYIKGSSKVLPKQFLPHTAMAPLGELNKQELVELVDFLGLHDLSEELRYIVDQKTLKNVYACLNPKEHQYLKVCMHQKEKIAMPTLGLDRWGGNGEKLKAVLQNRGIIRLGRALSGENPDFVWHIVHMLDAGRGQALLKYYSKQSLPGVTPLLASQVLNLMNILKRKSGM